MIALGPAGPVVPMRAEMLAGSLHRARERIGLFVGGGPSRLEKVSAPNLRSRRSSAAWLGWETIAASKWPLVVRSFRLCARSSANLGVPANRARSGGARIGWAVFLEEGGGRRGGDKGGQTGFSCAGREGRV